MAAMGIQAVRRPPASRVSREFVLELRARSARRPAQPIRPVTLDEVAVAAAHARDEGHELALDLSALKRIAIDPRQRTARVQAGATPAEVQAVAAGWGLEVPLDRGSFAPTSLLTARVVLPDGEVVAAGPKLVGEVRDGSLPAIVVEATYRLHDAADRRG